MGRRARGGRRHPQGAGTRTVSDMTVRRLPGRPRRKMRRWVVKAGSNAVCGGGPLLLRGWMQQIAKLRREHGVEVIWVTSGAIASAVDRTAYSRPRRSLEEKQALSAI